MNENQINTLLNYLPMPSNILHHDKSCCKHSLSWFKSKDFISCYNDNAWSAPAWIRREFDWGPTNWPLHWCELHKRATLDCGALAGLAAYLFHARGAQVAQMQLALRYPKHSLQQWSALWRRDGESTAWVQSDACYHEACGVIVDGELEIWDPTETKWIEAPKTTSQIGSVAALCLHPLSDWPKKIKWQGHSIFANEWKIL